ncbi:MAG: hypothetical protein WAK20_06640 [Candidatus Acidiferrum sp.]
MEADKVRQAFEKWAVREPYRFDVSRDKHDDWIYAVAEVKWLWDCWRAAYAQSAAPTTRFEDFYDEAHPFQVWWHKHGQYMPFGGGMRESIWAARGWIAREQMACGVEITGDSLHEKRESAAPPAEQYEPIERTKERALACAKGGHAIRFHQCDCGIKQNVDAPPPERPQLGTCHEVSFLHEKDKHAWAHDFDPETDKQVCVGWRAAAERPAATLEEEMVRIYIADRFALRCPACRGKNSKDAGGNKRCFHCGLCGFVECEWCSPAHEYLAESEREAQPMPECSHGKMMIEPCEPCGRAPVDIDSEALVAMREAQPLPKVSSLCQQTHHDFCAIPNCGCPCHVKEAQPLPKEKL